MQPLVYLAGPITGVSFDDATGWRGYTERALARFGIRSLSPLRKKVWLEGSDAIDESYEGIHLSSAKGIHWRDSSDLRRCDAALFNFCGYDGPLSKGSIWEAGFAAALNKPHVICREPENAHKSVLVEQQALAVPTLSEGIELILALLAEN